MGFTAWSLYFSGDSSRDWQVNPALDLNLIHVIVMGKVVAAMGMILLTLEDELDLNKAAQERERRARRELEAYTNLILARRRVEDFDRQGPDICEPWWCTAGFAGSAAAGERGRFGWPDRSRAWTRRRSTALAKLAAEDSGERDFLAPGSAPAAVEQSQTLRRGPDAVA
jgi:hypothetical protein